MRIKQNLPKMAWMLLRTILRMIQQMHLTPQILLILLMRQKLKAAINTNNYYIFNSTLGNKYAG